MRLQQGFSVHTCIHWVFGVNVNTHAVSCILYRSSGTSWDAGPHGRVPCFDNWFKCSLAMCLLQLSYQYVTPQVRCPDNSLQPRKCFVFREVNKRLWWIWMGTETRALTACHWVLLCTERATAWSLSFSLSRVFFLSRSRSRFLSRSLSLSLSLSSSLSLSCAPICVSI